MKHQWINILCLASMALIILTACQPATTVTEAVPVETEKSASPTEASVIEQSTLVPLGGNVKCRVRQSIFPSVKEDEWILGPKDAKTTIIEYGDFM